MQASSVRADLEHSLLCLRNTYSRAFPSSVSSVIFANVHIGDARHWAQSLSFSSLVPDCENILFERIALFLWGLDRILGVYEGIALVVADHVCTRAPVMERDRDG